VDFDKLRADLTEKHGIDVKEQDVISAALYPKVTDEFLEFRDRYGPVDTLGTRIFFIGPKVAQEMEV
jgi:pyruvate carboxylase